MVLAAAIKGEEVVDDPIDLTWAAEPLKVIDWLAKDTGDWSTNRDRCATDAAASVPACASWKLLPCAYAQLCLLQASHRWLWLGSRARESWEPCQWLPAPDLCLKSDPASQPHGQHEGYKRRAAAHDGELGTLAGIRQSIGLSKQCQPWMAARSWPAPTKPTSSPAGVDPGTGLHSMCDCG